MSPIGPIRWGVLRAGSYFDMPEVCIASPALPEHFDGFRIALLADLHLGLLVKPGFLRAALGRLCAAEPDLILLCGDLTERPDESIDILVGHLRPVCSRFNTIAVMGNHDYWCGREFFCRQLAAAGVDMVINEHRLIRRRGNPRAAGVAILGLDDYVFGSPDFAAAAAGIENGTFTILAAHHPDQADDLPADAAVDLMLCGHTHGGQVCLFGMHLATCVKNRNYVAGRTRGPGFPMYISRGLGCVTVPLRINADPELPIIILRRGEIRE